MYSSPGPNSTEHYALFPLKHSWVGVRRAADGAAVGLWYLSFMTLVLASHTASLVWWPIRESARVLAKSQRTRVREEGDIQRCGLFSWTGVNQWAWRSGASWRAMIRLAFMSRMSHSQSRGEALLACWRKPLVLIINDMSLNGLGPERAYCEIAVKIWYVTFPVCSLSYILLSCVFALRRQYVRIMKSMYCVYLCNQLARPLLFQSSCARQSFQSWHYLHG